MVVELDECRVCHQASDKLTRGESSINCPGSYSFYYPMWVGFAEGRGYMAVELRVARAEFGGDSKEIQ